MEKKTKELEQYLALRKELETDIIKKIELIREKTLTSPSKSIAQDIQILISVSDELDDVLLNWHTAMTSTFSISGQDRFFEDDRYVDEDED